MQQKDRREMIFAQPFSIIAWLPRWPRNRLLLVFFSFLFALYPNIPIMYSVVAMLCSTPFTVQSIFLFHQLYYKLLSSVHCALILLDFYRVRLSTFDSSMCLCLCVCAELVRDHVDYVHLLPLIGEFTKHFNFWSGKRGYTF